MFLTRECDYAIRIIRALADGAKKTVKNIAKGEQIPEKFAHNITTKLERANFVKSTVGRGGGVSLIRPLNDMTLVDIITAVDNNRCIGECLSKDAKCDYKEAKKQCAIHHEISRIQAVAMEALGSKTMDIILAITPKHQAVP